MTTFQCKCQIQLKANFVSLVSLQKKYLYACKNIVTKPNLGEFLRKLYEQYRIENCGKQYWICVATDRLFIFQYFLL